MRSSSSAGGLEVLCKCAASTAKGAAVKLANTTTPTYRAMQPPLARRLSAEHPDQLRWRCEPPLQRTDLVSCIRLLGGSSYTLNQDVRSGPVRMKHVVVASKPQSTCRAERRRRECS